MKKAFLVLLILIFASVFNLLAAGVRFEAKTWRSVQTYDARTLNKDLRAHIGELVAVKFNFRGKDIHHLKPNWYESSIWQPDPQGKKGFSDLRVMVAKNDLAAFKSITTNSASSDEITVYGRVRHDADNNFIFLNVIGRNVVIDPSGNAMVSW